MNDLKINITATKQLQEKNLFFSLPYNYKGENYQEISKHFRKIENDFNDQFMKLINIAQNYLKNNENVILNITPDFCAASFCFCIVSENKMIMHGGLILHGASKIFNNDLTLNISDENCKKIHDEIMLCDEKENLLCKWSIHT